MLQVSVRIVVAAVVFVQFSVVVLFMLLMVRVGVLGDCHSDGTDE